ncbi:MAG TPA: hypothetical protein VFG45_00900 [Candidatus Nitrosocosmicus sp.]|nr:hypothetical protein [Candidatus Nitrosocosmicus sp.]
MTITSDSYMGFFLPVDISERILEFLNGSLQFPFVSNNEIMGIFFLFGKKFGVNTSLDILSAKDISRKTIDQLKRQIFLSKNKSPSDSDSIREQYQRRVLQVYVEIQNSPALAQKDIKERISRDPTLLMYCYSHHISYYKQKCFFEIYEPLKKEQLHKKLHDRLVNRMIMLSYNVEKSTDLPFSAMTPFAKWLTSEQ